MPEQIMGTTGSIVTDVRFITGGSNALYTYETGTITTTTSFDSIGGSSLANLPTSGLAVGGRMDTTGSYVGVNIRNLPGSYALYVYDTAGTAGTTNVNITQVSGTNITSSVPVIGSVQISSITGAFPAGTALLGSVKATPDGYYQILGSPNYSLPIIGSVLISSITGALPAGTALLGSAKAIGAAAHDDVNFAGNNPQMAGLEAINHLSSPTGVSSADVTKWYGNRHGVPFVMGGYPNITRVGSNWVAAATNIVIGSSATGSRIIVTQAQCFCDNANTVAVGARLGWGATVISGGDILNHTGIVAGGGVVIGNGGGIIGIGSENLLWTNSVPTTGSITLQVTYYMADG